jgi:transcription antitermination factor NusG
MSTLSWFGIEVARRYEQFVCSSLNGKGYETYLPCFVKTLSRGAEVKKSEPAFPGYVFGRFDPLYRMPVLVTTGVRRIVGTRHEPISIPDDEIESLRDAFASGYPIRQFPYLSAGDRVRITSGPLKGVMGVLRRVKNRYQVIVSVHLLQRSVSVLLDACSIEPPKDPTAVARGSRVA